MSESSVDQSGQQIEGSQINVAGDAHIGQIGDIFDVGDVSGSYSAIGSGAQVIVNQIERALSAVEELEQGIQLAERRLARAIQNKLEVYTKLPATVSAEAGRNPYRSLLNYRIQDVPFFYGRQTAIEEMLRQLDGNRLTVLQAESGSGKTSLLQAGLAARLLAAKHLPLYVRPYNEEPQAAIKRSFLPDYQTLDELDRFRDERMSLQGFLKRVTTYLGERKLFIFLDQFEEFFLEMTPAKEAFAVELQRCVDDADLDVGWVISLREEAFAKLRLFSAVRPFENYYFLERFSREEARKVIVQPALKKGVRYEQGLVEQIIDDIAQEGEALAPVNVQLVCSTLYAEREAEADPALIAAALYEQERGSGESKASGAEGILRSHLSRTMERRLSGNERSLAWRVLRSLVTSKKLRAQLSRQAILDEVARTGDRSTVDTEALDHILDTLYSSRLVRVDDDQAELRYELAHEFLLDEIEVDPETLARKAAQEILDQEVALYQENQRLRIPVDKLEIIEEQQENLHFDESGQELLDLSRQAVRRRRRLERGVIVVIALLIVLLLAVGLWSLSSIAEANTTVNELATTEAALKEEIGQANSELDAVEATVVAVNEQIVDAEQQFRSARAVGLADASALAHTDKPQLSTLLAIAAMQTTLSEDGYAHPAAVSQLWSSLSTMGGTPLPGDIHNYALNDDSRWLATAGEEVWVWDLEADGVLANGRQLPGLESSEFLQFVPGSDMLITSPIGVSSANRSRRINPTVDLPVYLWDVGQDGELSPIVLAEAALWVEISENGQKAAVLNEEEILLFDLTNNALDGEPDVVLPFPAFWADFSPDGRWLATKRYHNAISIVDLFSDDPLETVKGYMDFDPESSAKHSMSELMVSADGSHVLEGIDKHSPDRLRLWSLYEHGASIRRIEMEQIGENVYRSMIAAVDPDRRWLAINRTGAEIQFIPLIKESVAGEVVHNFADPTLYVSGIVFSPDGSWAATFGSKEANTLWQIEESGLKELEATLPYKGSDMLLDSIDAFFEDNTISSFGGALATQADVYVEDFQFSQDGQWFSRMVDNVAELWHLGKGKAYRVLRIPDALPVGTMDTHWIVREADTLTFYPLDPEKLQPDDRAFNENCALQEEDLCFHLDAELAVDEIPEQGSIVFDQKSQLLMVLADDEVTIIDLDHLLRSSPLRAHDNEISGLLFAPNERFISIAFPDIRVWERLPHETHAFAVHPFVRDGTVADFDSAGSTLVFQNEFGLFLYDLNSGEQIGALYGSHEGRFHDPYLVRISDGGQYVATLSYDSDPNRYDMYVWELDSGEISLKHDFADLADVDTAFDDIAISPDGNWLAYVGAEEDIPHLSILNLDGEDPQTPLFETRLPYDTVCLHCLAFDGAGELLAVSAAGETIIWNVADFKQDDPQPRVVYEQLSTDPPIAFSPDGRWLAADLGLLDLISGEMYNLSTNLPLDGTRQYRFSADGRYLAAAGIFDVVALFDMQDLDVEPVMWSIPEPLTIAFKEDSHELMALSNDGFVHWMTMDHQEAIDLACAIVGRDIREELEWAEYFPGEAYQPICGDKNITVTAP